MKLEIEKLMDGYFSWLRDRVSLREVGDYAEITTPYLDRHNDFLQIYAKKENGSILLTDDGYILNDLELSGCSLETPKRKKLLQQTLNGFGISLRGNSLVVETSAQTFAAKKHNLVQSMLAVNDLFYLATPTVASLFYEDVVGWLDTNDVRYTPKARFAGKSGYDNLFDFVIPKSRKAPERILDAITRPDNSAMRSFIFKWLDTKETRPEGSKAIVILNDKDHNVSSAVVEAFGAYDVFPVTWKNRQSALDQLLA